MNDVKALCKRIRATTLESTTVAGSGHPTSSLSATELMAELFFGGHLKYDINNPKQINNDRIIFSKGHASPLLYSLYEAAGYLDFETMKTLRTLNSPIEGHPTPEFEPIEVATGSLGQGLSVGMGMALGMQRIFRDSSQRIPHIFVLMGDSEIAEGQIWEAAQLASFYKLDNLVGIIDVNRLGQRGPTMDEWDIEAIGQRFASFGWNTILLENGHDESSIQESYKVALNPKRVKPSVIVAKTIKGKGISFLENKNGVHGKAISKDDLQRALRELGVNNRSAIGKISKPKIPLPKKEPAVKKKAPEPSFSLEEFVATREAYGYAIDKLGQLNKNVLVLDAEVSNSTHAEKFKHDHSDRFFEMYIAEQNMVSAALGLSKLGYKPYVSSFAAFFTRAFDQIRIAQYSLGNIALAGSHAGVSIGEDGSSQMGLEDISMMRSINNSIVLYPCDAIATMKLVEETERHDGISYIRLTREKTPILYSWDQDIHIGGSVVVKKSENDSAVIITAGITLHEAIEAAKILENDNIHIAIIDAYSIKPLDVQTITSHGTRVKNVIVVEDHYAYGGLGEAVMSCLVNEDVQVTHLCVKEIPHSGKPHELLNAYSIDRHAIVDAVRS